MFLKQIRVYSVGEGYLGRHKGSQTYSGLMPQISDTEALCLSREKLLSESLWEICISNSYPHKQEPFWQFVLQGKQKKSADIASSGPISWAASRKGVIETIPDLWPGWVCSFLIPSYTEVLSSENIRKINLMNKILKEYWSDSRNQGQRENHFLSLFGFEGQDSTHKHL